MEQEVANVGAIGHEVEVAHVSADGIEGEVSPAVTVREDVNVVTVENCAVVDNNEEVAPFSGGVQVVFQGHGPRQIGLLPVGGPLLLFEEYPAMFSIDNLSEEDVPDQCSTKERFWEVTPEHSNPCQESGFSSKNSKQMWKNCS
jgi:hypothetical protein